MATNTTNYNLVKPAYADTADIADINGNMDIIDGQMKTNADGVSANAASLGKTEAGIGVIVTGDTCPASVPAGGYAYIKSNTHGLTEGLYRNKTGSAFPTSGGTANSTVFEAVSRGGINALKSDIDTLNSKFSGFKFENIGNISSLSSQTFIITNGARMALFPCGINADIQGVIVVSCNAAGTDSFITKLGATSLTVTKSGTNITIQNTTYQDVQIFGIVFAGSIS